MSFYSQARGPRATVIFLTIGTQSSDLVGASGKLKARGAVTLYYSELSSSNHVCACHCKGIAVPPICSHELPLQVHKSL